MENLPTRITDVASQAEEEISTTYSRLTPLRAAVAAIPLVGSTIDAFLGTRGQNIAAQRLERTIQGIQRQIVAVDMSKLDGAFLESEEFYDLLWRAFEEGQRTANHQKVALYVRILLQSLQAPPFRENAHEYLALLAELSSTEIQVAAAAYRHRPKFSESNIGRELTGMSASLITSYLARLERTGLVRFSVEGRLLNTVTSLGEGPVQSLFHLGSPLDYAWEVSEYFRRMMAYLELNDLTVEP